MVSLSHHFACVPLAQIASVDYSSLTAIMILHKQHLSAHLSLFPPPGCLLSSIHLLSISSSLPAGWKCMLPPRLKITPRSPLWYLRKTANVNCSNWCLAFLVIKRDEKILVEETWCVFIIPMSLCRWISTCYQMWQEMLELTGSTRCMWAMWLTFKVKALE